MSYLQVGSSFPDFELEGFDSAEARAGAPLVVIFWRIGCSTSRLTVPFFDRLQDGYPGAKVVGVCQETPEAVAAYVEEAGLRVRHLADQDLRVSRQFGIQYAPTYFLTDSL